MILVAGLPATGKTSFARYLSGKTGIPMVSKDIIKEHLFDTVGFNNRQEKVNLGTAAMDLMYHFASLNLELGKSVILENNFENVSKPGLLGLIDKYRCKTVMVRFHTDIEVLSERFLARDQSPDRHRGHVINTRYPEDEKSRREDRGDSDFVNYYTAMKKRGMEYFSVGCPEIIVDSTDFSKVNYDELYARVIKELDS